jgi:hypothetical protein
VEAEGEEREAPEGGGEDKCSRAGDDVGRQHHRMARNRPARLLVRTRLEMMQYIRFYFFIIISIPIPFINN